jgi:hypothetical protein
MTPADPAAPVGEPLPLLDGVGLPLAVGVGVALGVGDGLPLWLGELDGDGDWDGAWEIVGGLGLDVHDLGWALELLPVGLVLNSPAPDAAWLGWPAPPVLRGLW